jgi:pentatricopeptide repeat protein
MVMFGPSKKLHAQAEEIRTNGAVAPVALDFAVSYELYFEAKYKCPLCVELPYRHGMAARLIMAKERFLQCREGTIRRLSPFFEGACRTDFSSLKRNQSLMQPFVHQHSSIYRSAVWNAFIRVLLCFLLSSSLDVSMTSFAWVPNTGGRTIRSHDIIQHPSYVLRRLNHAASPCTLRRATIESIRNVASSFASDDDDEEDVYDDTGLTDATQQVLDDDENYNDLNDAALEHSRQQEPDSKGMGGTATQSIPNQSTKSRNMGNSNPAFHDPQFLRKRTSDLLKVTERALIVGGAKDSTFAGATQLGRHMKVEKKTFHFLLDAWAFSGEMDAAEQAMTLLRRMEDLGQFGSSMTAMTAIQPDVRSYTKAINAIARQASLTAGEDAEVLLEKMRNVSAAASHTNPELAASIKPNTFTYTAVIQAYANSGAPGSPQRAEALIERMIDKCQRGDDSVRPTARTFNAVIHAYGKAGNAERAAAVFARMERLYESGVAEAKPNAFHFNALISAWANCDLPASAQRAEEVLGRMERLYKAGDVDLKPTTVSFNAVIDAFAKSGEENAAQKAELLLRHMYDIYEAGNVEAKPNTRSFNSVINAWAKSRDPNAASNAAELLELMEEKYDRGDTEVRPDAHSFCTVINGKC